MTSVELEQICHRYGDQFTLDPVNLVVPKDCYLVVLGKTGSGKTTLLHVIAGLQKACSGRVLIDGASVDHLAPRHRPVSMVFQDPTLFPHRNVQQNLRIGLGSGLSDRLLDQAVQLTEIGDLLERFPEEISGGQRRKVAIASAICQQAKLRLLDEPLASLDLVSQQAIEQDLARIHRSLGGTTIHVTHDGAEAMRLADLIAVIDQGRIVQMDSPSRLYDNPSSLAVANSLAHLPVNQWSHFDHGEGDSPEPAKGLRWQGKMDWTTPCRFAVRPEHLQLLGKGNAVVEPAVVLASRKWQVRRLRDRLLWRSLDLMDGHPIHALTDVDGGGPSVDEQTMEAAFWVAEKHVMVFRPDGTERREIDQP